MRPALFALLGLTCLPVQAAPLYLNSSEVLDTGTGLVWLKFSLTAGLGVSNAYTDAGWQLSIFPPEGPSGPGNYADTSWFSLFNDFPAAVTPGPEDPEVYQLIAFLRGDTALPEVGAETLYSNGQIGGLSLSYSDGWIFFDGSESQLIEDFVPSQYSRLALYRPATEAELALVPLPATGWLLASALPFLRRRWP